jgi:hypothetical protein
MKLLGDAAAVSAMLDRLLHHGHVFECGPRSWNGRVSAFQKPRVKPPGKPLILHTRESRSIAVQKQVVRKRELATFPLPIYY